MKATSRRTLADWFLLVKVAFAGLAGGGLAVSVLWLLKRSVAYPALLLVLLITILGVAAVAALQSDGGTRSRSGSPPMAWPAEPKRRTEPARAVPNGAAAEPWYAAAAREPARPTAPPGRDGSQFPPPAPGRGPVFAPPPPALAPPEAPPTIEEHPVPGARRGGAARVRRVVQCPGCGDFQVDLWRTPPSFAFACRRCGHRWDWAPGRPWPATIVRPSVPSTQPG